MNNKKNKSKNRGKFIKTPQGTESLIETLDNIEGIVKPENVNTEEIRVPEIICDSITIIENNQSVGDVPKKPKRNKSKKKKEVIIEDIKTTEQNCEISKDADGVSGNFENSVEEVLEITPCVRKKKKKVKKQEENLKENLECDHHNLVEAKCAEKYSDKEKDMEIDISESTNSLHIIPNTVETMPKDDVSCKKKKKKKHRHDSEKSDKYDLCTLAFQKLIEPSNIQNEADNEVQVELINRDVIFKDNTELSEVSVIDPNQTLETCETTTTSGESTNKKNNVHSEKYSSEEHICVPNDVEVTRRENEDITVLESLESKKSVTDIAQKPRAIIAKPVQRKHKTKSESESVTTPKSFVKHNLEINTSKGIDNEFSNAEKMDSSHDNICVTQMENLPKEETNELTNILKMQQEEETLPHRNDDLGFVEVKTGKNKKKRNKHLVITSDLSETMEPKSLLDSGEAKDKQRLNIECSKDETEIFYDSHQKNIDDNNIGSEEVDTQKIIIPDLIEYPRSTSQQFIDSNNNTIIQEIATPEEVELGISFSIPRPIIEGSGESPEANGKNQSITLNVTEILPPISSKNKEERKNAEIQYTQGQTLETIDVKSKIIEVNRDMEFLRQSIERSLTELTAIEKSDAEVDKEFEKLFQSQTLETKSIDPECSMKISEGICDIEEAQHDNENEKKNKSLDLNEDAVKQFINVNLISMDSKINNNDARDSTFDDLDKTNLLTLKTSILTVPSEFNDNQNCINNIQNVAPVCPARRDKGKNKSKKKNKKDTMTTTTTTTATTTNISMITLPQTGNTEKDSSQSSEKSVQKSELSQEKSKQQKLDDRNSEISQNEEKCFEPIEYFEDALTSSVDDVNKTFEIIAKDATESMDTIQYNNNPLIHIISPTEDTEHEEEQKENKDRMQKQNPISHPKNLLGHTNIPVSSSDTDYKEEKYKPPSSIQAKVKIKDSVKIEKSTNEQLKTQIMNKRKLTKESNGLESTHSMNRNEDLIFKYSYRKVFLQNICQVCKKDLVHRVSCKFCSLVFYCNQKHKDEDWSRHQSLCFAVSTIAHLKEQKHIYAGAQNIIGHDYRVLRMQMILSCEKILNRKLVPWEQEALLYPRICADVNCRQWKQGQLKDCEGCGQRSVINSVTVGMYPSITLLPVYINIGNILYGDNNSISYCIDRPEHLPSSHQCWCKSYALYQKLVSYQQTKGRLEPRLPTKVLKHYQMPGKINDVLGTMYEEKIDMDDIQYAALTQIATAPLTVAYCWQLYASKINSTCANGKSTFTIHMVGTELPFEADALNKWEIFFLHLLSDVQDLRVVMVGPDINSSKLPLDLLAKIKLCENCQTNKRRVLFDFHDNENYHDYYLSDGFVTPDLVCAFNPNIQRSSVYNTDTWSSTINCILKQRVPFVLTSHTIEELRRDVGKIRECARVDFNIVSEIKHNSFCSVRPDRNFITDHEIPLLFKNYCFCILCGSI